MCSIVLFPFFFPSSYAIKYSQKTYQRKLKESQLSSELYTFKAGIFTVRLDKKHPPAIEQTITKIIQRTMSNMNSYFNYTPTTSAELILLEGNTYDSIDDPDISTGGFYANKKIRMKIDTTHWEHNLLGGFEEVFRHEYSHLVIASIGAGRVPRWLDEGLATYLEKGASKRVRGGGRKFFQERSKAGTLIPIERFVKMDLSTQYKSNNDFYTQSYLYTKYLIDTYGFYKFRELLKNLKEGGMNFTHAFPAVYGMDLRQLEQGAYDS